MSTELELLHDIEAEMTKLAHAYDIVVGALEKRASEELTEEEKKRVLAGRHNTLAYPAIGLLSGAAAGGVAAAIPRALAFRKKPLSDNSLSYILKGAKGAAQALPTLGFLGGVAAAPVAYTQNRGLDDIQRKNPEEYRELISQSPRASMLNRALSLDPWGAYGAHTINKEIDMAKQASLASGVAMLGKRLAEAAETMGPPTRTQMRLGRLGNAMTNNAEGISKGLKVAGGLGALGAGAALVNNNMQTKSAALKEVLARLG